MPAPKPPESRVVQDPQFGIWLNSPAPILRNYCRLWFDWLLIDGEHGPNSIRPC